jgi:hypothetical protein
MITPLFLDDRVSKKARKRRLCSHRSSNLQDLDLAGLADGLSKPPPLVSVRP